MTDVESASVGVADAVSDGTVPEVAEASSGGLYPTINLRMTEVEGSPGEVAEAVTEEATGSCLVGRFICGFDWYGDIGNRDDGRCDDGSGDVADERMCGVGVGGLRHTTINLWRLAMHVGTIRQGAFFLRRRRRSRRKRRTRWRWRCRSKCRVEGRCTVVPGSQPGQRRSAAARSDATISWRKR